PPRTTSPSCCSTPGASRRGSATPTASASGWSPAPPGGAPSLARLQAEERELRPSIAPHRRRPESGSRGERAEAFHRVLVRVLGVDRLPGVEAKAVAPHAHALALERDEVHLDPAERRVVEGVVREALQVEPAAQLAVDPGEEIEVE